MNLIKAILLAFSSKSTHDLPDGDNFKAKGALDYESILSAVEVDVFYTKNVLDRHRNEDVEFFYQRLWDKSKGLQYHSLQNKHKSNRNDSTIIQYYDEVQQGNVIK